MAAETASIVIFLIITFGFVGAALYTWYAAVKREYEIRKLREQGGK